MRERYAAAEDFFRAPRPLVGLAEAVQRDEQGSRVVDLRWDSDDSTFLPELRERYHRRPANQRAAARLWLHTDEPRPAMVLIHGYLAGQHSVEERLWPSRWLHHRLGLDLAFFVLPFHGVRASSRRLMRTPPFPAADPRVTNEGFRQAIGDLMDLMSWLRARGAPHVGVMGMSLGGYTTALMATVAPVDFAVPVIPLTSLADFARDQGRLGHTPEEEALEHAALDAVHHVISPLHRPPLVGPERVMIVAAEADRITPIRHAERLAEHFAVPLHTFHGGHLLQFGRKDALRRIGPLLRGLGVISV